MGRVERSGRGAALRLILCLAVGVATLAPGLSGAVPPCSEPADPAGEWTSYGGDLTNSRRQVEETLISPANVGNISKKWSFSVSGAGGSGVIATTPVVSGGCLFITSSTDTTGWVYAVDAGSGALIWKRSLDASNNLPHSLVGGAIVGTVALASGCLDSVGTAHECVIALVSPRGSPYVVALDRDSGVVLWQTRAEDVPHPETFINASPIVWNGLVFAGLSGYEALPTARGGFTLIDVATGALIMTTYTIPDADYPRYAGASIWTTPAIDTATGFAYVGGGNPASKRFEHPHANALMKIDLNRTLPGGAPNPTFGRIVDAYKGNTDQYYPGLDEQPLCDAFGDHPNLQYLAWSIACLQLDLDFGASPNLFSVEGRLIVGDLQKSGVYHAAYADTMEQAWTAAIGTPCFACNASSGAFDDTKIYTYTTVPGQLVALSKDRGRIQWVSPVADGLHFQSVTTAYGVVYVMDTLGFLDAVDASTGLPLLRRAVQQDTGSSVAGNGSNGIAVARNRLFVAAGTFVVAYGL